MSVLPFWVLRLYAIAAIWFLRDALSYKAYFSLYLAVLFGHYVMAAVSSRTQLRDAVATRALILWTSLIVLLSIGMATFAWPNIIVYFGVHHVLSELYTPLREQDRRWRALTWARGAFNAAVYVILLLHYGVFDWIPADAAYAVLIFSYLLTIGLLVPAAKTLGPSRALDLALFESLGLAVALLTPSGLLRPQDLIFYHLCFWFLYPVTRAWQGWTRVPWRYFGLTAVLTLAFWALTPAAAWSGSSMESWFYWSTYFGSLHISLTFLLSKMNPRWISAAAAFPR